MAVAKVPIGAKEPACSCIKVDSPWLWACCMWVTETNRNKEKQNSCLQRHKTFAFPMLKRLLAFLHLGSWLLSWSIFLRLQQTSGFNLQVWIWMWIFSCHWENKLSQRELLRIAKTPRKALYLCAVQVRRRAAPHLPSSTCNLHAKIFYFLTWSFSLKGGLHFHSLCHIWGAFCLIKRQCNPHPRQRLSLGNEMLLQGVEHWL